MEVVCQESPPTIEDEKLFGPTSRLPSPPLLLTVVLCYCCLYSFVIPKLANQKIVGAEDRERNRTFQFMDSSDSQNGPSIFTDLPFL